MTNTAVAGEVIDFNKFRKKGKITILPPCDSKTNGDWYCIVHDALLYNPFEKEDHLETHKDCRMAWNCNEHGLEQP